MAQILSLSSLSRSNYDTLKQSFKCSNADLEEHIKRYAFSHQKEGLFQTYFYLDDDGNYLGYISVAIASIERDKTEDKVKIQQSIHYTIPALKITRLCIFEGYERQGIGSILINFVLILAVTSQKKIGCRAIIVDSKHEAVDFYKQFDFIDVANQEDDDTVFMIYDLLKPNELEDLIDDMVEFCQTHNQNDLIAVLTQ